MLSHDKELIHIQCKDDDGQEIYDLIANIVHDGEPKDGTYRIHVNHRASGIWKEIQVRNHIIKPSLSISIN